MTQVNTNTSARSAMAFRCRQRAWASESKRYIVRLFFFIFVISSCFLHRRGYSRIQIQVCTLEHTDIIRVLCVHWYIYTRVHIVQMVCIVFISVVPHTTIWIIYCLYVSGFGRCMCICVKIQEVKGETWS